MKRVAVLGGGPAGSFAAERLARAGLDTVIFDEKLAWEKPCGGGLTYKAWNEYPFLIENDTPKKLITQTNLSAPKAGSVALELPQPLLIYSRFDLNHMLLKRAENAGAQVEKARVMALDRKDRGWLVRTRQGSVEADFCVVATGARNPLPRRLAPNGLAGRHHATALGYYVPGRQARIDIQFLPGLEGYIWVFPRCGHLSVGFAARIKPAQFSAPDAWNDT
jgi:flavin-dependent dehydrogenase